MKRDAGVLDGRRGPVALIGLSTSLPTPPLGNRPRYPGKLPPYRPNEPCYRQQPPDLNGPAAAKTLPNSGATTTSVRGTSARPLAGG